MQNNGLSEEELRLSILKLVKDSGSETQKINPLPTADIYYKWIKGKTIRKNLADKKEQTSSLKDFKSKNCLSLLMENLSDYLTITLT